MADMIPQGTQEVSVPYGHETSDANVKSVFTFVVVLLSLVLVVMVAMKAMFDALNNREAAKDAKVPATFAVRQLPPGPPLLPSPQKDELPWAAYAEERGQQEAVAAKAGIIDPKSGFYKAPGSAVSGRKAITETRDYFQTKYKWDSSQGRYTQDTTGGIGLKESNARFGTNGTEAPEAISPSESARPEDRREIGTEQIKPDPVEH